MLPEITDEERLTIVLPWPDKRLSPNARIHWAAKAPVKAKARQDGAVAAFEAMATSRWRMDFSGDHPIPIKVTFYPPDRRHRDDDNCIAALKSYRDGIADALGVNDKRFRPSYHWGEPEKPGRVEVEIC